MDDCLAVRGGAASGGLAGRLAVVLEPVAPRPGFFGSVLAGEARGRGERADGVDEDDGGGSFLAASERLDAGLPVPLGVRRSREDDDDEEDDEDEAEEEGLVVVMISSSGISSAARASSTAFGSVGLSKAGRGGSVGVAERRGGG